MGAQVTFERTIWIEKLSKVTPTIKRTKQYCSYNKILYFFGFVDAVRNDAL